MSAGVDPATRRRPLWLTIFFYASAALLALLAVGPALWLVIMALQETTVSTDGQPSTKWSFSNFVGAWNEGQLAWPLLNSVLVTAVRTILNVFLAALAAYPLSRMSFKGRDTLFVLILATMMIPEQVIIVPMFRTVVNMGLADTLMALIIPMSVSAFGIFMCRQSFMQIPASLEEAARIDGATSWQIFWKVVLPVSVPTLSTLALFSIIAAWSDLLWPLLVLTSREHYTLPVAVNELLGVFSTKLRYAYAGSVLALIPIIVVFILSQKWFKPQMMAGAVKG